MTTTDENIVAFLGDHYGSLVATRALWQWAGGDPGEILFSEPPAHGWAATWTLARDGAYALPIAILREALFDRPGDATVLGFLESLAEEAEDPSTESAESLVAALAKEKPDFDASSLLAMCGDLPTEDRLLSFAAVAPRMNRTLTEKRRTAIEAQLEKLTLDPASAPAHLAADALRDALTGTLPAPPDDGGEGSEASSGTGIGTSSSDTGS